MDEEDIDSVKRLGRKQEEPEEGQRPRERPLLVSFQDIETKKQLFKNISKLKDCDEPISSLRISNDMTKQERDELKLLLD